VAGCCEHDNETSGSIKGNEFLDVELMLACQEGLCSMKLVWLVKSFKIKSRAD
jgi:hypothetical protein